MNTNRPVSYCSYHHKMQNRDVREECNKTVQVVQVKPELVKRPDNIEFEIDVKPGRKVAPKSAATFRPNMNIIKIKNFPQAGSTPNELDICLSTQTRIKSVQGKSR